MAGRVLVFGNCHAQYLGAALKANTDLEVVVAGKLFEGPIHFDMVQPNMMLLPDALEWVKASPEKPILVYQATPQRRYDLSARLEKDGLQHDVVKLPYVKFDVLEVRKQDDPEVEKSLVKRAMRADRVFNELSIIGADGKPEDVLPAMKAVLAAAPNSYSNNHFTGAVFAELFAFMRGTPLAEAMGGDAVFEAFLDKVRGDKGVSHLLGTTPPPAVAEALGLKWNLGALAGTRYHELQKAGRVKNMTTSSTGVVDFTVFRILVNEYKKTGKIRHLRLILELYKDRRFYLAWANYLADQFIERGRPARAAVILLNRLEWDDTRGSAFSQVLARLLPLSRSEKARQVFEIYAAAYPESNIPLARDCIQRLG